MLFPPDGSYFQMLSRFIDSEIAETANVDWRGMLAGIGIIKEGKAEPRPCGRGFVMKVSRYGRRRGPVD